MHSSRLVSAAIVSSLAFASAPAGAQWSGFIDRSAELRTDDFSFTGTRPEQVNSNENYYDGDFADFDGDGLPDRALGARYGLLRNTGGGLMTPFAGYTGFLLRGMPGASGWGEDGFQWVDVDGDGDLDNLSGGNGEPLTLQVNERGRFRLAWQQSVSALNIVNIDLEGDGDVDLAVAHSFCSDALCGHGCPEPDGCTGGSWPKAFNLMINDGTGTYMRVDATARGLPAGNDLIMGVVAGDVDADGDTDLVFLNGVDRRFNLGRNDGTGRFTTTPINFGVPVRTIGPISSGFHQGVSFGDIDGDGDLDFVAALDRDIGTHPNVGHAVFTNDGAGNFTETSATAFDVGAFAGMLNGGNGKLFDADYDGDLDFVAFSREGTRLDVFENDGTGTFTYRDDLSIAFGGMPVSLGNDTDVADLDGDGAYDVWIGSGGQAVRILLNSYTDPAGVPADMPRALRATAGADGVTLTWDAPPFAATARSYRVYRASSPGLDWKDRRVIGAVGNVHQDEGFSEPVTDATVTFTDTEALPGATYYYTVTHVGTENDESVPSPETSARRTPPSGADTTAPTVDILTPTREDWAALTRIVAHYADGGSGVDPASVRVSFDQSVGGRPAGANLVDLAYRSDAGVTILALPDGFELPLDTLVTLTVSVDDVAGNTGTDTLQFFVQSRSDDPPTASFTASPAGGDAPIEIVFDASASTDTGGKILAWEWYFGDGTTAVGRVVSHTYVAGGTFTATLLVRDNEGGVSLATRDLIIGGMPAECTTGETRPCYSGPAGTAGTGACTEGIESCVGGAFGACSGEVVPSGEVCDNGADDDCDGAIDAEDADGCTPPGEDAGPGGPGGRDGGPGGGADAGPDGVPPIGGSDDGCGCAATDGSPPAGALAVALAVALLLRRRKR